MSQVPKRRQHYVPQFYLRNFSSDLRKSTPRRINLYNIPGCFILRNIGLRDQCFRRSFYGPDDHIENGLASLESEWAVTIKQFCESDTPPLVGSEQHLSLLSFLALQLLRTPRHALQVDDSADQMAKSVMEEHPDFKNVDLDSIRIQTDNAVLIGMQPALQMAMCFSDLRVGILEAPADCEFITSDAPVVTYNLYCEGYRHSGTTGAAQVGLLVYVPLSPRRACLLYDGKIYKVGRPGSPKPIHCQTHDVFQINGLEFLDAHTNLYFQGDQPEAYFSDLAGRYGRARMQVATKTEGFVSVTNANRSMYHQYRYVPSLKLNLSFLTIRRNARRVPLVKRVHTWRPAVPLGLIAPDERLSPPGTEREVFRRTRGPKAPTSGSRPKGE